MELFNDIQNNIDEWTGIFQEIEEMENRKEISAMSGCQFDYYLKFLCKKAIPDGFCMIPSELSRNIINVFNLYYLSGILIDLCNRYNKIPSMENLVILSGLNSNTINYARIKKLSKQTINSSYYSFLINQDELYISYVIDTINSLCDSNYHVSDILKYNKKYSSIDNVVFNTTSDNIDNIYNNINNMNNNIDNCIINFNNIYYMLFNTIIYNINLYKENNIKYNLLDGKKNPVGSIAVLNHDFSWDKNTLQTAENQGFSDISALPDFSDNTMKIGQKD